jgi:hypothetical protein
VWLGAQQAGNANFQPATTVWRKVVVSKSPQGLFFSQPQNVTFSPGATFRLYTWTSSGLPATFWSGDTNVVSVSGNTATIRGAGTVWLAAMQPGNANYLAATNAWRQVVVSR